MPPYATVTRWVGLGALCTRARECVPLRCVFDCLSHVGPQNTGFSGYCFFAIGKRGTTKGHLSVRVPLRLQFGHVVFHAVVASPSSWSTGLPLTSLTRGMENLSIMLSSGLQPPTTSHALVNPVPDWHRHTSGNSRPIGFFDSCYTQPTNVSPEPISRFLRQYEVSVSKTFSMSHSRVRCDTVSLAYHQQRLHRRQCPSTMYRKG